MPNTVQFNEGGIVVNRFSETRIADNTISGNTGDGISVNGSSFARIGFSDSDVAQGGNAMFLPTLIK